MLTSMIVAMQSMADVNVTLDALTVAFIVGTVIPLLVNVVAKSTATPGLKAIISLVLSVVASVINVFVQADGSATFDLQTFVITLGSTFLVAVMSYLGLWKPTGVSGSIASGTANFGLGKPVMQTDDKGFEEQGNPHAPPR